ncbi:TPA: hypothetical protein ACJMKJ_005215 [Bacillus wiedmannii]
MKVKGITRGQILLGMEQGAFSEGDRFKRQSDGTEIHIVCKNRLRYPGGNPVEIFVAKNELWDALDRFEIGEWVFHKGDILIGKITKYEGRYYATDNMREGMAGYYDDCLRRATPEEILREQRRRMFSKYNRGTNEFRIGDCVKDEEESYLKVEGYLDDGDTVMCSYYDSAANENIKGRFKVRDLIPVFFVEDMVCEQQ